MVIMTAKVSKSNLIAISLLVFVAVILLVLGLSSSARKQAALPENGLQGGKMPQPPASHEKTKKNCKNLLTEGLVLGIVSFAEGL